MNHPDTIVDEVRRIRDAYAAKFNYDPDAIFQDLKEKEKDLKEKEKRSGRTYVSFADERVESVEAASGTASVVDDNPCNKTFAEAELSH